MGTGGEQGIVDAPEPVQTAGAEALAPDDVADRVVLHLPAGGRVLVASDLHLTGTASESSTRAADTLAAALDAVAGPAIVVLAGDCFELLVGGQRDPEPALAAHPQLTTALAGWGARADRSVVVLPGNHDGALGWDPGAIAAVRRHLGATISFAADLDLACGTGHRLVRIEHGHQLDPSNAFVDPRDPAETPLGHHVVSDVMPLVEGLLGQGWARGLELVADPLDLPEVVASRLTYRRVAPALAWATLPGLVALALGVAWAVGAPTAVGIAALVAVAAFLVVGVAVVGGALFWGGLGWRTVRGATPNLAGEAEPGNDAARRRARDLAAEGVDLYVTGHTHIAELSATDGALYANAGCGGGVLHRRPGRGPLPAAFAVARHVSWVDLTAGEDLLARLVVGFEERPGLGRVERWATAPAAPAPADPTVVAVLGAPARVDAAPLLVGA